MKQIAIGDHVRLITGKEQGYVRAIRKNVIDVEIEEGFIIPVLDKEVAVISSDEKKYFQTEHIKKLEEQEGAVDGDIFMALVATDSHHYNLFLINQTLNAILFTSYISSLRGWQAMQNGNLKSKEYVLLQNIHLDKLDKKHTIAINWLPIVSHPSKPIDAVAKNIQLSSKWLIKQIQPLPILNQKGFLISMSTSMTPLNSEDIKNAILKPKNDDSDRFPNNNSIPDVIDLHIESILDDVDSLPKNEILRYQLDYFDKELDRAILANKHEITFIHGVGNGTLKYNIQKKCSGHPHIAYFKDAMKEKFGYGAIYVKIK